MSHADRLKRSELLTSDHQYTQRNPWQTPALTRVRAVLTVHLQLCLECTTITQQLRRFGCGNLAERWSILPEGRLIGSAGRERVKETDVSRAQVLC
eukprot:343644-Pelagomonas_calceolata.AAC.4